MKSFSPFVFLIIEHNSRRVVQVEVTRSPSDEWVALQIREATQFADGQGYYDKKYGPRFEHAVEAVAIEVVHTPYYTVRSRT